MAELQGYFLKYKDDPNGAINNFSSIDCAKIENADTQKMVTVDDNEVAKSQSAGDKINKPLRKRRMLTALEVDKMPFNPQYDWEKDIYKGPQ